MVRWRKYEHDGVKFYRFSVYRMGLNVQTVYTFIVGDTLIDTAQRNNREFILEAFKEEQFSKIILTHFHEDHSGNVAWLQRKRKIPAFGHPETVKILKEGYSVSPLGRVITGNVEKAKIKPILETEIIEAGDFKLQPIFSPGHSHDHYSYYEADKGWLFSGDLFVAERIKYFADFESMSEQILSIEKLCQLDFDVLFCSHNPKLKNGKQHLVKKLQYLKDFYGEVVELSKKGLNAKEILEQTGRKENKFYDLVTLGSFNAVNMVKSVLKDEGILH